MKIKRLSEKSFSGALSMAERVLRSGRIIITPTDTVYGIIGDATQPEVIKRIFEVKRRPQEKTFPIFVKDIAAARRYAYISDEKAKFLEKVWPGAVTVVFHHKEKLPKVLTAGKETIGIRIPNHSFLLKLLTRLDFPLVQTSANISGKPPAKNIKEIKEYFGKQKVKPELVIDGGEFERKPSTVIDFTKKEPAVLRMGLISKRELDQILGGL